MVELLIVRGKRLKNEIKAEKNEKREWKVNEKNKLHHSFKLNAEKWDHHFENSVCYYQYPL